MTAVDEKILPEKPNSTPQRDTAIKAIRAEAIRDCLRLIEQVGDFTAPDSDPVEVKGFKEGCRVCYNQVKILLPSVE